MKTLKRGFIVPLLLIIVAIFLVGGGAYFYTQTKSENPPVTENVTLPQATSTIPAANQTAPVAQTSKIGRICGGGAMANGGACPAGYLCKIVTKGPPAEGTCQVATASPTISSIEVVEGLPTGSVYAGQTAEIFGTDLRGVVSVKIGEQNVPIMTGVIADRALDTNQSFKVPSLPVGVYNVSVTNSSMQTSAIYPVTVVVYSPNSGSGLRDLKGTFIAIDPIYSSGIRVANEQDVEKVFNTYINWARQNNQTIFNLLNSTDFKYKGAQVDGIYEGIIYWKMKFSQPAESGNIFDTYVDVSEKGEIVGFLRGV